MKPTRTLAFTFVVALPVLLLAQMAPSSVKSHQLVDQIPQLDWTKQAPNLPSSGTTSFQSSLTRVVTLQASATQALEKRVAGLEATVAALNERIAALEKK